MRTSFPQRSLFLFACIAALGATSCGKKKKHDDSSSDPEIRTTILEASTDAQGVRRVVFKSNIKDATYECQTEVNGQPSEWAACQPGLTVTTQPGAKYVLRVRAIDADGDKDKEPAIDSFEGPRRDGSTDDPSLSTVILNKGDVTAPVTAATLKLTFGVRGGAFNPDEVTYECKREQEADFRRCGNDGTYTFSQLVNGGSYELTVRAVIGTANVWARPDTVAFKVQLADINLGGEEELARADAALRRGESVAPVTLTPNGGALPTGTRFNCKFDDAQDQECPEPLQINLNQMPRGPHALVISALGGDGAVLASRTITFCVAVCEGGGNPGSNPRPAAPPVTDMQIGSFYTYHIPAGMHMTQYATTKGYNTSLRFYRVLADSDPYYIGNYGCYQSFDSRLSALSPGGISYDYCLSTPPRDFYKQWLADFRLANNHLELATDHPVVDTTPEAHERILINVFDADYEYMHRRSRFEELCLNKRGDIRRTMRPIRFINADFWGEAVRADFWMCVAELAGSGPGLPGSNDEWYVGAFYITSAGLDLPQHECVCQKDWVDQGGAWHRYNPTFCGTYRNPSLLEVVYMTKRRFNEASDFAQFAQTRFMRNLQEIVPVQ